MSKFYEAREILIKFSQAGARVGKFEDYAKQICQLFPKSPDNSDGYEPKVVLPKGCGSREHHQRRDGY